VFADDPLAPVGATKATVLEGEISHETPWLEDPGGRQLGVFAPKIDGPYTIPHFLQVARYQRVTFVA